MSSAARSKRLLHDRRIRSDYFKDHRSTLSGNTDAKKAKAKAAEVKLMMSACPLRSAVSMPAGRGHYKPT